MTDPRTGRRATFFVSWNTQIGSPQLPASVAHPHRLRSAGRLRCSHRHVARNACPLISHACFVLGFAFCCRVLSRVSQVPILSASFWHYLHFLVQSARIFFACGGQKHSISFFSYTEGRAHLSHERPPVFDTRSVAHACRSNLTFVLTISRHWCAHSPEPSPYTRTLCTHADCCMRVLVQAAAAANTIVAAALGLAVIAALALSSSLFCYHHHRAVGTAAVTTTTGSRQSPPPIQPRPPALKPLCRRHCRHRCCLSPSPQSLAPSSLPPSPLS